MKRERWEDDGVCRCGGSWSGSPGGGAASHSRCVPSSSTTSSFLLLLFLLIFLLVSPFSLLFLLPINVRISLLPYWESAELEHFCSLLNLKRDVSSCQALFASDVIGILPGDGDPLARGGPPGLRHEAHRLAGRRARLLRGVQVGANKLQRILNKSRTKILKIS